MVGGVAADPNGRWVASGTFAGQFSVWRLNGRWNQHMNS